MSVMCCRVPEFLIGLAKRREPELEGKPVALLGADEHVWAASAQARQSGVCLQMPARQARMRCPDVQLQELDLNSSQAEPNAFVATLAECGLPVEASTWGMAYVDLHAVGQTSAAVGPYCADLGRQVRGVLGDTLAPAIGWDSSKFTARTAASYSTPSHMRRVDRSREQVFLSDKSIDLLPLSPLALQQLDWLGIRTLGQFARLPSSAVWQRFGAEGKLAQKWAKGKDDRPVRPTAKESAPPLSIDFDPPTGLHAPVLEAILNALHPALESLARKLEGCRRLRIDLQFGDRSARAMDCVFVEPVSEERRIRETIGHQLEILNWPAELAGAKVALLECGELVPRQLTLFAIDMDSTRLEDTARFAELADKLNGRYGSIFFQPQVADGRHPVPERRAVLNALGCAA